MSIIKHDAISAVAMIENNTKRLCGCSSSARNGAKIPDDPAKNHAIPEADDLSTVGNSRIKLNYTATQPMQIPDLVKNSKIGVNEP